LQKEEAQHTNYRKTDKHMNEESTDILSREQDIFVLFSK